MRCQAVPRTDFRDSRPHQAGADDSRLPYVHGPMMPSRMKVALWGNDLILGSKVQAVARDSGAEFTICRGADIPGADVVFVDLNSGEAGITTIGQVRSAQPETTIVGFCG